MTWDMQIKLNLLVKKDLQTLVGGEPTRLKVGGRPKKVEDHWPIATLSVMFLADTSCGDKVYTQLR